MWKWNRRLALCCGCLLALPALADTSQSKPWQVSGFLTQVWSVSDHNNFFGNSSDGGGSFSYHEFGLNGSYSVDPGLRLSGQVLSRANGHVDDGDPGVDYLFADWSLLHQPALQAGVRVGRIKNPIGFYNETRDVAFTRPSILLPQSIYLERIRNLERSSDGIGGYLNHDRGNGRWQLDLVVGEPQMDVTTEFSLLGRSWQGHFSDPRLALMRVLYEHDGGRWRGAYTYVDASAPFKPGPADPITPGQVDVQFYGFSGQFNGERWSLTGEYAETQVTRIDLGPLFNGKDNRVGAYFLQAEYRLDPTWTLLGRYDRVAVDKRDPDGVQYHLATGLPAHQRYARDWTLGVGHQLTPRLHLRGELHSVEGTAWLSAQDNPNPLTLREHWTLFMMQLSYRF